MLLPRRAVLHSRRRANGTCATFAARCAGGRATVCVCAEAAGRKCVGPIHRLRERRETVGGGRGSSSDMHMASRHWKAFACRRGGRGARACRSSRPIGYLTSSGAGPCRMVVAVRAVSETSAVCPRPAGLVRLSAAADVRRAPAGGALRDRIRTAAAPTAG